MMHAKAFLLPPFFDYSATFLWAISGAVLGARRGYAILGIITIALVSSTGGGLLRDGLFIQDGPPVLVRTQVYLWLIAAAVVGMVNAVGGGILRDVLMNAEPDMFKPGTLDQASALAGCLLFLALIEPLGLSQFWAAWITIAAVFGLRVMAIRYRIESRPLRDFRAYWGGVANGKDEG
jgi:uncharacterized membrane protein YeiH